jgi:hypothetical protein
MLAFIPRKWRLTRWQVLLGAAATIVFSYRLAAAP